MSDLNRNSKIGDVVYWLDMLGQQHQGMLVEWDCNVAIINENGKQVAVEC